MGLNGAGLNRFRERVDATLADAYPAQLRVGSAVIDGSGPGGRAMTDFINGGESPTFRFPFRMPRSGFETPPAVGDVVVWLVDGTEVPLEISETQFRPQESVYGFVCKHARL